MRNNLFVKTALLLSLAISAAAQSAPPVPKPKAAPIPDANATKDEGRGLEQSPVTPRSAPRRVKPVSRVKPPTAGEESAPLKPPAPTVKPPTAGETPTALTPSVKPPTATKAPTPAKANRRPVAALKPEPFAVATVEQMAGQCVTLETEAGLIEFEVYPEHAPETVRAFLNMTASGALDTTTFSRVVKGFVVQGGNLSTSARWNRELAERASRSVADEPNQIKHERGVVSMARSDQPNSAATGFFFLIGEAKHLDGTFSAFGRVRRGMDVVDGINQAPATEEKPEKPVKITKAKVAPCPALP